MSYFKSWQCDNCGRMFYQDFPPGCCDNCGGTMFSGRGIKDGSSGNSGSGIFNGTVFFLSLLFFRALFRFMRWVFGMVKGLIIMKIYIINCTEQTIRLSGGYDYDKLT